MPVKLIPFSFSRLDNLAQCARKYHAINVAKSVKEEESEQTQYGHNVHTCFADYFKLGKNLPLYLTQYQRYLTAIRAFPGEFITEQKLAINAKYEATGWFDSDVYCRIISDLTIINGSAAVTFDWKTGKLKPGFKQLRLSSAVMMLIVPELERITHCYFWLKEKTTTRETITRADIPGIWTELLPEIQNFQNAYAQDWWPPKPSYLCKGYCPVTTCQYWEARRKR